MEKDKSRKIRILVADDHQVVRQGLRAILELEDDLEVVAETQNGRATIDEAKRFKPDVILMDIRMPGLDGIATSKEIKKLLPQTRIIILTSYQTSEEVNASVEVGVDGYLLKDTLAAEIIKAIKEVAAGKSYLDPSVTKKVLETCREDQEKSKKADAFCLTPREVEILKLMTEGYKNKDIAGKLWISEATVKAHVSQVLQKLKVSDRAQAVLCAVRKGLVDVREDREK